MSIDYSKARTVTARQFIKALKQDGFVLDRQKGSHQHYLHSDGRRVTVSYHSGSDTFPLKTLKRMIEDQANWDENDLIRLKLIK